MRLLVFGVWHCATGMMCGFKMLRAMHSSAAGECLNAVLFGAYMGFEGSGVAAGPGGQP